MKSFELLDLGAGLVVLDLGSGLGEDAIAMGRLVAPEGWVVGVDFSRSMIEQARERAKEVGSNDVVFAQADAANLPYADRFFDRVRIDRTLQHIPDPSRVIAEVKRVLKSEGTVVVYDNDWETFTLSVGNREVARRIANHWCDSFPSGWVGRYLKGYLSRHGFSDIRIFPQTLQIDELETADKVFDLFRTLDEVRTAGLVDEAVVECAKTELREQDAAREFFCSYTGFLVAARVPG